MILAAISILTLATKIRMDQEEILERVTENMEVKRERETMSITMILRPKLHFKIQSAN